MMLPPGTIMTGDWVERAACAQQDPEPFVRPDRKEQRRVIERFCHGCEVREECLEEGLNMDVGVWGGATPTQRRRLRTKRARLPEADLIAMLEAS